MLYVMTFENGDTKYLKAENYTAALDWADYYAECIHNWDYTIEEYFSEEEYLENI